MKILEFEGKTTEEAIQNASKSLNVPAENLKFKIISAGSKGFLGFFKRLAKITVDKTASLSTPCDEKAPLPTKKHYKSRDDNREHLKVGNQEKKGAKKFESCKNQENVLEHKKKTDSQHKKHLKKDGQAFSSNKNYEKPAKEKALNLDTQNSLTLNWADIKPPITKPASGETIYDGAPDPEMLEAKEVLAKLVQFLGIEVEISCVRIGERIILNMESADSALLIGRKGSTLDALQYLVNKIILKSRKFREDSNAECGDDFNDSARYEFYVVVDAEDYRARRQQNILDIAQNLAMKVQKNGRPLVISHLTSHERRLIHLALQNVSNITTKSQGNGLLRNLIILPKE